jgi:hypothetical protein
MALAYLFATPRPRGVVASPRPQAMCRSPRSPTTTWRCCDLFGAADASAVSTGAAGPLRIPLRTCEDNPWPGRAGYIPGCRRAPGPPPHLDAAEAWVRAAHAHPANSSGWPPGPLTNLALAIRREPGCPDCCGGWSSWAAPSTTAATPRRWPNGTPMWIPRRAAEVLAVWGAAWGLDSPTHDADLVGAQPHRACRHDAGHPGPAGRRGRLPVDPVERARRSGDPLERGQSDDPGVRGQRCASTSSFHFDQGEGYLRICTIRWPRPSHWIRSWCATAGPPWMSS